MTDIDELMQESPLDEDDLIDGMRADNDEGDDKLLTADLISEGLKFATNMEQHFLTYDHDTERALKFQRNLQLCVAGYQDLYYKELKKPKKQLLITNFITIKPTTASNNNRNSSFQSNATVVEEFDVSLDDYGPGHNKRARLL